MKKIALMTLLLMPFALTNLSCDEDTEAGTAAPQTKQVRLPDGAVAPDFALKDLSGKDVSLADYKGSVILLEFWAAWCPPCQQAIPQLQKLHEQLEPKGLKMIAVCTQSSDQQLRDLLEKHPDYRVTILHDKADKQDAIGYSKYLIDGYPSFFVIGKDGKIVQSFKGFNEQHNPATLTESFAQLGIR